jgi:hypothetical protein
MLKNTLFVLAVALLLGSCTITEEISFNKNYSGSGTISYNLALYGSEEEVDSTLNAQRTMAEEYKLSAKDIPGISNIKYRIDQEESMMVITYDFADLKSLNALYQLEVFEEAPFMRKTFEKKGKKKLSVTWPVHALTEEDREAYEDEMMDMYTFDLTISLPREIKSSTIDTDKIEVVTDQKKAYFKGGWGDFYTHTKPVIWRVKM